MRKSQSRVISSLLLYSIGIIVVWLVGVTTVLAAEVKDLYSAEIPVHGQDDNERIAAIRLGIATVIVKVSGQREAASHPEVQNAQVNPMRLVQQYRYFPLPEEWQQATDEQGQFYGQLLRIRFDSQSINNILRSANLPVWGRARPSTLVWLAVEDWNQREIVGADSAPRLREVLKRQASMRGVPILFPLLDLEDQSRSGFADIWGDFQDTIMQASQRYQTGTVLVGRMYRQNSTDWEVRWTLYQDDMVERWTSAGKMQQQALVSGLDMAVDQFAQRFAQLENATTANRLTIRVNDVATLADYARVKHYLEKLDLAQNVLVQQVEANYLVFSLALRGSIQGLEQAIKFGETLAPGPAMAIPAGSDVIINSVSQTELNYRLLP